MKKLFAAVLPLGLALAPSSADARTHVTVGSECQPDLGSTCINYSQFGAHNICGSTQALECPITHSYSGTPTITQFYYVGYDRHSTQDVSCTIRRTDGGGNILFSSSKNTTGDSASSQTIVWLSLGQTQTAWWSMRCTLPPAESGDFSHLASYVTITSE